MKVIPLLNNHQFPSCEYVVIVWIHIRMERRKIPAMYGCFMDLLL